MKGTFEISIPEKYVISAPDLNGNETNTYFNTLADKYCNNIIRRGWSTWNGDSSIHAIVKDITVNELVLLGNFEGTCLYYCPFIKVAESNMDYVIPEGLPNRTYLENEIEVVHTWRTWRDESHPLSEPIEGYYYFMSAPFGQTLSGEELMLIYNDNNATLVDEVPNAL